MKKLLKSGLIIISAAAFSFTVASAKCDSGNASPNEMKCQAGKCGTGMAKPKVMKCQTGKCGTGKETNSTQKAPEKGKCGQGKCG